jgi:hemerythrin-like domain-containing protein
MLYYIEHFPERLHHPKEEAFLFGPLREVSPEHAELVAELERQHREGSAQFAALRRALAAYEAGEPGAAADFIAQVEPFAQSQWRHMAAEEKVVLPAAERLLGDTAWRRAIEAFLENGDPRFGSSADAAFADLFTRLLNLLPAASAEAAESAGSAGSIPS